ncbi:RNA exonuclease [Apiospora phragmitis]|uniref:RNA exonuclease n=1 Tax=Apiospora phragmitis TaxID=2905665 RepID=A0ABR1TD51_9PEZI
MEITAFYPGDGSEPVSLINGYPPVNLSSHKSSLLTHSLRHGANSYISITENKDAPQSASNCRRHILEALQLRCQTDQQLVNRRFILPTQSASEQAKIKLPLEINLSDFIPSSAPNPAQQNRRAAIAIDCEMVGVRPLPLPHTSTTATRSTAKTEPQPKPQTTLRAKRKAKAKGNSKTKSGARPTQPWERSELPAGQVTNWRTKYSGANARKLAEARATGQLLPHWRDARAKLLEYMDAETVLVGHSVENDLHMLRLSHGRIVDTALQTAAAVFGVDHDVYPRAWRLKDLTARLTGNEIQTDTDNNHNGTRGGGNRPGFSNAPAPANRRGHDCIEDTLATRELALWCLLHPAGLSAWGAAMRQEMAAKVAAEQEKRRQAEEEGAEDEALAEQQEQIKELERVFGPI